MFGKLGLSHNKYPRDVMARLMEGHGLIGNTIRVPVHVHTALAKRGGRNSKWYHTLQFWR